MVRAGLALMLLCHVFLVGCVSSNFMPVGGKTYPPRPDEYIIDVFVSVDAPVIIQQSLTNAKPTSIAPKDAQVIGRIDTSGAPAASYASMVEDAKKKARQLGGDAIVIGQWGTHLTGMDGYGNAYHAKNVSMTVLRFRP